MLNMLGRSEGLSFIFPEGGGIPLSPVSQNDFSRGKIWRIILRQAIPLTVAQAVQVLYMWWTGSIWAICPVPPVLR